MARPYLFSLFIVLAFSVVSVAFASFQAALPELSPKKLLIMCTQAIEQLEVLVPTPSQLHELLNDAEEMLRQAAMAERSSGIMVTRHNPRRYTLALSDVVPFGETWEQSLS